MFMLLTVNIFCILSLHLWHQETNFRFSPTSDLFCSYCVFNHLFSSEEFVNRFWLEELNVFILVLVFLRLIFFNSNCRQSLSFSKCVSCNRNLNLFVAKNVQYLFHGGSTWLKRWRIRSKSWIDLVFWS